MNQLTPMDIHNKEFKRRGRNGYDSYEVDSFLDKIVDDYGDTLDQMVDLKNENVALNQQIDQLKSENKSYFDELQEYKGKEQKIDQLYNSAKESASNIENDARLEANKIIDQAEEQAKLNTKFERQQKDVIEKDYQRLKSEISEFRKHLQDILEEQIDNLNDKKWQEALDDYFNTPRFYPDDGSEPIGDEEDEDDSQEVDKDDDHAIESTQDSDESSEEKSEPQPMTGDSPSHETMNVAPQPTEASNGPTIVFPDNYKDHN